MASVLIHMEFDGHAVFHQRFREHPGIEWIDGAVFQGGPDETRRGVLGHLEFVGEERHQVGRRVLAQQVHFRPAMRERSHGNDGVAKHA